MFVVTKTHNFDPESEAALFDSHKDAIDYLHWLWCEYLAEEVKEGSDLDAGMCFVAVGGEYAQVEWYGGDRTMFDLIEVTQPREYSKIGR